jgi:hypothetical protein
MTREVLVWVHGDSLSIEDPAVQKYPRSPRVFVFDRPWLRGRQLSFKRLFFIYESAGEVTDEIRWGDPVEEIHASSREHGCGKVAVTWSAAPRFAEIVAALRHDLDVEVLPAPALVSVPDDFVPRRFTAFWKKYGQDWH